MKKISRNSSIDSALVRAGIDPLSRLSLIIYVSLTQYSNVKDHFDWSYNFRILFDHDLHSDDYRRISNALRLLLAREGSKVDDSNSYWDRARFVLNDLSDSRKDGDFPPILFHIDTGSLSNENVGKLLGFISRLYVAMGGSGITFTPSGLSKRAGI